MPASERSARGCLQTALRLLSLDPLQEAVHRTVMQLYVQLGRRGAALRHYQGCVAALQRELGAEPEAETRTLYQEILRRRSTDVPPAAAAPRTTRWVATAGSHAPLIGRERELTVMRAALDDVQEGRGRVVVVVGEAGIGKSRLVAELLADAAHGGARILVGRAHEAHRVLPLAPWADALRNAEIAADPGLLAALHPDWLGEIARLVPELGRHAPQPGEGTYDSVALFEGVAGLIGALAGRSPLVVVLEDLHRADDMTVRLASFVARRIERTPVLLVLTARDEELDPGSLLLRVIDDLAADAGALHVALTSLAREDTLRLVRTLTSVRDDTLGARLGEQIWAASEGHPLMAVEMSRAVGAGHPAETPLSVPVPQRVQRLIESRFQQLGPMAQQLVATAAVIGRDFPYTLLQGAAGVTEEDAVAGLEELVRRRVVHAVGERFEFTHDRLREVASASLLAPRRKLLHRRVAEALERLGGADLAEHRALLGTHYAEAEVWDRAAQGLYEAAGSAHERTAYREAVALLERALAAVARLPRSRETILLEIDIRLRLFRCLNPLADPQSAAQVAQARALAALAPDDAREATIFIEIAELRRLARDVPGAIEAGERGLALATKTGQPRLLAQAHFQLGVAHVTRGRYDDGIAHLTSTAARLADAPLGERLGYPYVAALCRLGWALADLGDLVQARRYTDGAAGIAERTEHVLTLAEASTAAGVLRLAAHQPADALAPLERALELACAHRIAYLRTFSLSWLALALARCGRRREAAALLDEYDRGGMLDHVRLQWSRIVVRVGEARLLLGDGRRAGTLGAEGLALARSVGEPAGEAEALALLADVATASGPDGASEAGAYRREAAALAERLGLHPLRERLRQG